MALSWPCPEFSLSYKIPLLYNQEEWKDSIFKEQSNYSASRGPSWLEVNSPAQLLMTGNMWNYPVVLWAGGGVHENRREARESRN